MDRMIEELKKKRYFREKGEEIKTSVSIDYLRFEKFRFEILEINGKHIYPLFLSNGKIEDGGESIKKFLITLLKEKKIESENGTIEYEGVNFTEDIPHLIVTNRGSSNTILEGDKIFIKFYRKLLPSSKREEKILRSIRDCFKNVPELLGCIFYENYKIGKFPLFIIFKRIKSTATLWEMLLRGEGSPSIISQVGRLTANFHNCLLKKNYKKITPDFINSLLKEIEEITLKIKNTTGEKAKNIEKFLNSSIKSEKLNLPLSEIHGDYHLGQIIYDKKRLIIVDFEGEPALSKREYYPILYDVAGMIRSFDYLRINLKKDYSILNQYTTEFLNSYFLNLDILPSKEDIKLLSLLILRKNVYEVFYELENRPELIKVPLLGLDTFFKIFSTLPYYNWA